MAILMFLFNLVFCFSRLECSGGWYGTHYTNDEWDSTGVKIPGQFCTPDRFLTLERVKRALETQYPTGRNPLQQDHRRAPEQFVHDNKLRDAVLKDRFKPEKVPDNLDAVIIGSGAGGLSAGVLLTFAGMKVLVLEQHDQAGGCCHTFVEKGFEFDTGIHYVGDIQEGAIARVLLDQLSCGQLRWAKMDDAYDTVAVGKPGEAKLFPMKSGDVAYYQNLRRMFPQEKKAIHRYEKLMKDANKSFFGFIALKVIPPRIIKFLINSGLYRLLFKCYRKGYAIRSLQEVLDELTDNKQLKLVLSYICGDYGVLPKDAPLLLHAILVEHYIHGGFYPVNGASEIPFHMIQAIQRGGGKVLVQASVTKILCDSTGRTVGMEQLWDGPVAGVQVGRNKVEIRAKYIISDAGVANTFKSLLPQDVARQSSIYPLIDDVGPSFAFLTAFIGLDGNTQELRLPSGNVFVYTGEDINQSLSNYLNVKADDLDQTEIPYSLLSFSSAKDPEYNVKFPGKSAAIVLSFVNWECFKEWKDEKVRHRGDRYEGIKDALGRQMWQQVVDLFPQLEGRMVYLEVGTPVTNQHYLACPQGEMYGLGQRMTRFLPEVACKLRAETDIKGLYLTGQDTLTCGFVPSVLSGLLCVSSILNRNVHADLVKLQTDLNKRDM